MCTSCLQIEESAKKSVEASTGSAVLKLYNRWHEKVEEGEREGMQGEEEQKKKKEKRSSRSSEVWCVFVYDSMCKCEHVFGNILLN